MSRKPGPEDSDATVRTQPDGFLERTLSVRGRRQTPPRPSKPTTNTAAKVPRYGDHDAIGRGAMGDVYRVIDRDLNRAVAMKVLSDAVNTEDAMARFVAEAQISGQLEHPGLLPIHDIGIDENGRIFFTMRFVAEHRTLKEIIGELRRGDSSAHAEFTFQRRVHIVQQLCHALSYAHERGVIHRDIKPANVLIGPQGEVYLADWGVAGLTQHLETAPIRTTVSTASEEGELAGTPLYMAPEQFDGADRATFASDVYSLCAVAYELLSLHHYLGDERPASIAGLAGAAAHHIRIDAEAWVHPQNGRVPRQLSRILRKGLRADRSAGFATADELELALQSWLEGRAPVVCPGTFIQRLLGSTSRAIDRRPTLVPAVVIVAFAVALLASVLGAIAIADQIG